MSETAGAIARSMGGAICHRGPDDEGVWLDAPAGIAFAHRRLSIVDLSPAGHQPMISASGRYVIAFNGEIYNHADVRRKLETDGVVKTWRGHSDTEVLLEAIAAWGVDKALRASAGMFAIALWDRTERTLILARDRLGEKPLYFGWSNNSFLFASDLAAMQKHPSWTGEIDRDALALMMRFNHVPAPHSIYRGIRKLQPGTYLVLGPNDREPREHVYWDAFQIAAQGLKDPFAGDAGEATLEVEALLRQALNGQMLADVPLGAFLSGGVDSSTIVALMQDMSSTPVKTFTIGFEEDSHNEADHARFVARHLGTDHRELMVSTRDAQAVIPKLPAIYSEPFADSSQIPTFLVSQLARRHVTVSLSGDGGDELFSGYRRYDLADRVWPKLQKLPRAMRKGVTRLIESASPATWDKLGEIPGRLMPQKLRPQQLGDKLHKAARILALNDADEAYDALVSHWSDPSEIVVGAAKTVASSQIDLGQASPVRRMMFRDMTGYLPDDILVKVDRAAMAVSLESRVPLLDHRLVEFTWRLPVEILRKNGQSKWPLRQILYRHVPRHMIERPKTGFAIPLADWLRGGLRPWAEELLSGAALTRRGDFHALPIRTLWEKFVRGETSSQEQLWNVLMFQAWRQHEAEARS